MPEVVKFYPGIVLVGNTGHGAVTGDYPPRLALLPKAVEDYEEPDNPAAVHSPVALGPRARLRFLVACFAHVEPFGSQTAVLCRPCRAGVTP